MQTMICPKCNKALAVNATTCPTCDSPKSPVIVLLLCLFLGVFGMHRFYVRKFGTGILMLCTLGGFGAWAFIDLLFIVLNKFEDKMGRPIVLTNKPSALKKAVMVIGSIIASTLIAFGLFIGVVMYASSGVVSIVKEQLNALQSGDISKAYSYTSTAFQKASSLDDFKAFVNNYPELTHNKNTTINSRNVEYNNGVSTGKVGGTVHAADGKTATVSYRLLKENGVWKIEEMTIHLEK